MTMQNVDVLQYWSDAPKDVRALDKPALLRLGPNLTAIRLFTSQTVPMRIHFVEEPEVNGWVRCNGERCVLCEAGKSVEERMLLPVYVLSRAAVEILAISPSSRPGALRPQILPLLQTMAASQDPVIALVHKPDRMTFKVTQLRLDPHHVHGEDAIKGYKELWEGDRIDPASVFPKLDNTVLGSIAGIALMLQIKGVMPSDDDQRE